MKRFDTIWYNANLATMERDGAPFGAIEDGAVAARGGTIAWIGRRSDLPDEPQRLADRALDAGDRWITPGLIDPHTHLIFGGDRVADFERRVAGQSYAAAASGGSGIAHTVAMTRAADDATLYRDAARRMRTMIASGATTVEVKSGYGLDVETELRLLRIARRLGADLGVTVRTTYLGAHVVPPEYAGRREAYLALVCDEMLPHVAGEGLADAVDVFCDTIAFSPAETAGVLETARALGLPVKLHADQIADTGADRARGALRRALGRPPRARRRGRRRRTGAQRHRRRSVARRVLLSARDGAAADRRRCAPTACRSRSRPTAIPARRR